MLNEQTVTSVLKSALLSVSKDTKIGLKTLRVQMKLSDDLGSVECMALNKTEVVSEVSWTKMLGLKVAFKGQIVGGLTEKLLKQAEENEIEKRDINMRVYASDAEGKPSIYLYNGGKAVKPLSIKDLI